MHLYSLPSFLSSFSLRRTIFRPNILYRNVGILSYDNPKMLSLVDFVSQCYPPKPRFTEKDIPELRGKVTSNLYATAKNMSTLALITQIY